MFGIDSRVILTVRGTSRYVYTTDLRGSTASILNDSRASECVYYYDVYGEPEVYKSGSLYNEIMYTGAVYDESTGLLYLSSRFYDAESGRFTSMDSYRGEINDPLSLNYYGYCEGNPIKSVDDSGHIPIIVAGAIAGAVVGGGSEAISEIVCGEKLDIKSILISTGFGAASGALTATGYNTITTIAINGFSSFGENFI